MYTIEFKTTSKPSISCTETVFVVKKENRLYSFHFREVYNDSCEIAMIEGHSSDGKHIVLYNNYSLTALIDCYFDFSEVLDRKHSTKWTYL